MGERGGEGGEARRNGARVAEASSRRKTGRDGNEEV